MAHILYAALNLVAPQATTGALDPCGSPSLILFFPAPPPTHTRPHTWFSDVGHDCKSYQGMWNRWGNVCPLDMDWPLPHHPHHATPAWHCVGPLVTNVLVGTEDIWHPQSFSTLTKEHWVAVSNRMLQCAGKYDAALFPITPGPHTCRLTFLITKRCGQKNDRQDRVADS